MSYVSKAIKIIPVVLIAIGFTGYYFGWFDYGFVINTPIGSFYTLANKYTDSPYALTGSIYPILNEIYQQETTLAQNTFFEKYKGFLVADKGQVYDIGSDGKTLLIKGSGDNRSIYLACKFQDKWQKRILIMNKGDEISFRGTIVSLDTNRNAVLDKCDLDSSIKE